MRRSICELTKPSARRELRLAGISTSTTADVHIRVLTAAPRIKPTSTRCHSAWQPKPGRGSTYRRGDFVQTSGTSSNLVRGVGVTGVPHQPMSKHIAISSTEAADRLAIRELIEGYAHCADRRDAEG